MAITIDFSDVPDRWDPLAEGKHLAEVVGAKEVVSSQKGTPGIEITWRIGEQMHLDKYWVSPKAMWRIKMLYSALGVDRGDRFEFIPEDLLGKWGCIEIEHRQSECGKYTNADVKRVHSKDAYDASDSLPDDGVPF